MIELRVAEPEDLYRLDIRPEQPFAVAGRDHMAENFERLGESWAFVSGGRVFLVAGLIQAWPGRGMSWAMVGAERRWHDMMKAGAILRGLIDNELTARYHRIEAYADASPLDWWVACDWWLRRIGFNREGVLSRFTQDGRDQAIYARVRTDG